MPPHSQAMKALLAVGGEPPPRERLAARFQSFGLVAAADSGLELLHAWGLAPQLIVGDMDSLKRPELLESYPGAEIIRAERAKDESDTEMGLRLLAAKGAEEIVIAGGGGGRLDHLLAIRSLFERPLRPIEWQLPEDSVHFIAAGESLELEVSPGDLLSVFPLAGGASGMLSEGLRWPLEGLEWGPGDFGLSNEATSSRARVEAGRGALLLVRRLGPA